MFKTIAAASQSSLWTSAWARRVLPAWWMQPGRSAPSRATASCLVQTSLRAHKLDGRLTRATACATSRSPVLSLARFEPSPSIVCRQGVVLHRL